MEHGLEIIGTIVGILYLWLEYRASIYLWIAGIIMPAVYIFVYYEAGLYADFSINIYYMGAAIYGWMMWKYGAFLRRTILKRKDARQQSSPITHMPTMLSAVVKESSQGTLLSVKFISIQAMPRRAAMNTAVSGSR